MYMDISWLVGGIPTPMKNISSSVGIMTFPIEKNKFHVPNHQPDGNIVGVMYMHTYIYIYTYIYKQQYEIGDCVLDSPSQL